MLGFCINLSVDFIFSILSPDIAFACSFLGKEWFAASASGCFVPCCERNAALMGVRALNLHLSPDFHQNSPLGAVYTIQEGPA